jgi:hypothetical protein
MFSKIFQYRYSSLGMFVILILAVLASCGGGDDNPTPTPDPLTAQQERAQAMAGTWNSSEVRTVPDDIEDAARQELEALSFTFNVNQDQNPTTFSASGAPTYFNTGSGASWAWADATTVEDVNLSAVSPVSSFTIDEFTATSMTISFTFEGPSTSRLEGLGTYTIVLAKQ